MWTMSIYWGYCSMCANKCTCAREHCRICICIKNHTYTTIIQHILLFVPSVCVHKSKSADECNKTSFYITEMHHNKSSLLQLMMQDNL